MEDEPYSNNTELGTRRDPQGELMEEPESNQNDQVDKLNLSAKGLAECRQTDITSHVIKMTDNKPIRHKVRPVPYHCREEFQQIIRDQLAAGIIRPSTSATCSPVNLVLKE